MRSFQHGGQEGFRRQGMGSQSRDAILVLAALCLFLRAGLLFHLVPEALGFLRRHHPLKSCSEVDGMQDRPPDNHNPANAMFRLERSELWQRLYDRWVPTASYVRKHEFAGEANRDPE